MSEYKPKPFPWELESRGHVWRCLPETNVPDIFALEHGRHNGPICVNCGYTFRHHCERLPSCDCPVRKEDI